MASVAATQTVKTPTKQRNFSMWKRPQLESRKLQMGKLTGKGKHKGRKPHINMVSKSATMRRVQMQDTGNTLEIETSNLKQSCSYTDCYIKTSWEPQTKNLP